MEEKQAQPTSYAKRIFSSFTSLTPFLIHTAISFLVIAVVVYFLGYRPMTYSLSGFFSGPLSGNDALNHLTYIVYLNEHFPRIPLWFPYQGGGISATLGYPQLYSYTVILLSRIAGLSLVSSMAVVNFASILLPAWGVYLFVATRLGSKTGGLLAGLMYLLSPMAYVWIWGAGFFAQTFSVIFVPLFLICFDWLLDSFFKGKGSLFALFLTSVLGTIASLAHPATLMGLLAFAGLYTFGRVLFEKESTFKKRATAGVGALFLSILFIFGLSAFWFFPLQSYLGFAGRDMTVTADTSVFAWIEFKGTLGLYDKASGYGYVDFSIAPPIWILAILGTVLGFIFRRKVGILGVLALLSIYFVGSLDVFSILAKITPLVGQFFTLRPWYPLSIILTPSAAAMGVIFLARLVITPLVALESKKFSQPFYLVIKSLKTSFLFILSLVFFVFALLTLSRLSGYYDPGKPWIVNLGPSVAGINFRGIWNRIYEERCLITDEGSPKFSKLCTLAGYDKFERNTLFAQCAFYPKDREQPNVCKGEKKAIVNGKLESVPLTEEDVEAFIASECDEAGRPPYFYPYYSLCLALGKDLASQLVRWPLPDLRRGKDDFQSIVEGFAVPENKKQILTGENHRIDISSQGFGSTVKSWNILNKSSMLNAYTGQLMLNKSFYSIFGGNMYENKETPPQIINNLAHYFGTEALAISLEKAPVQSFSQAGWEVQDSLVFPPFKTGLVSVGLFPKVLVIGSRGKQSYQLVFRNVVKGIIPFDRGLLVDGPEKIGDLNASELSKFDLLILQGYQYKNRNADLTLLKNYVAGGGSVFIDTGWQYVSPDWGRNKEGDIFATTLPEPLPVARTQWGGVGKTWENAELHEQFSKDVSVSGFGPLTWQEDEWSVARASELRSWAKPILAKGANILIAGGQLGKGKIVWSGMNIIAHAEDKKSYEEIKLLANIFDYLLGEKRGEFFDGYALSRPFPDKLVVTFERDVRQKESLYLKESYYPSWSAKILRSGKTFPLKIHQAGPSFMLVELPALAMGDSIVFEFGKPQELIFGLFISLLTACFWLVLMTDLVVQGRLLGSLRQRISHLSNIVSSSVLGRLKKIKENFSKEDGDY